MGDMISPTSELTMAPKAAPMITPMARSTAFPRSENFLNSSIMGRSRVLIQAAPAVRHSRARRRSRVYPQIGGLNCQVLWGGTAPRNDGETDTAPKKLGLREVSPSG